MSVTKLTQKDVAKGHPMEGEMDLEPNTTITTTVERSTELVEVKAYDEKDNEIEGQMQEVYDAAMDAYDDQMGISEQVEGKYKARNAEVAVQFLTAALHAAKEKRGMKEHKDKLVPGKGSGSTTINGNQTNIVADRNELLKMMREQDEKDITPEE